MKRNYHFANHTSLFDENGKFKKPVKGFDYHTCGLTNPSTVRNAEKVEYSFKFMAKNINHTLKNDF